MPAIAYPRTRYAPVPLVDLTAKDERVRLSTAALKGFFQLATRWELRDEDAYLFLFADLFPTLEVAMERQWRRELTPRDREKKKWSRS